MAKLIVRLPDGRTREYPLHDVNKVGRHPNQTLQIMDRLVSKEHIVVRRDDDGWILQDLGSLNGTYVNDERITGNVRIKHRDRIAIGQTTAVFQDEAQAGTGRHEVEIGHTLESSIRNSVEQTTADEFAPSDAIHNIDDLKRDYEKLRIAARLQVDIAGEVRMDRLLPRLLDQLFALFPAERGVILLQSVEEGRLVPRAVKVRGRDEDEKIELSKTILSKVLSERTAVLTNDAQTDARFSHARSVIIQGIQSSLCVPLLARDKRVIGIIHLDSRMASHAFTERDLGMLQGIAQQSSMAIENAHLVEQIEREALTRQNFEKMLSPGLVEKVVSGELLIEKGGELRGVAVMFTDIRGFTSLAERSKPQDMVKMLNEYFEMIVDVIFDHEGTVDKFMGDGVMAIWGAPVEVEGAAEKALEAAVNIQKVVGRFNALREMDRLPPVRTGIGVDSGQVIAGYMGSSKTMSYTVVGPCVNVAARLCGRAGPGETLVTASMFEGVSELFEAEVREPLSLKGISQPVPNVNVQDVVNKSSPTQPG